MTYSNHESARTTQTKNRTNLRSHIIDEIRRLSRENGNKAPGVEKFSRETGVSTSQWSGVFSARWSDALEDAGLPANVLTKKFETEDLLQHLAAACVHHGRSPTKPEMQLRRRPHESFPSFNAIMAHFGNRSGLVKALREWASAKTSNRPDVLAILAAESAIATAETTAENCDYLNPGLLKGWVYLLASGGYSKIGRSDDIERRIKSIAVSQPDKTTLLHAIETDDPAGIEAYWHRRFADRRAHGEWFKLTKDDLATFKRRKFQ